MDVNVIPHMRVYDQRETGHAGNRDAEARPTFGKAGPRRIELEFADHQRRILTTEGDAVA